MPFEIFYFFGDAYCVLFILLRHVYLSHEYQNIKKKVFVERLRSFRIKILS